MGRVCIEETSAWKFLTGKSTGKRLLERPKHRLIIYLEEMSQYKEWIDSVQDRDY